MQYKKVVLKKRMKAILLFVSYFYCISFSSGKLELQWENPRPTGDFLKKAVYALNKFYVVGSGGTLLVSSDGSTWENRTNPDLGTGYSNIFYGKDLLIIIGRNGALLTSPDGDNWTKQSSGTTNNLYGVAYGNNTFVAVGSNGTVITSSDGSHWSTQNPGTADSLYSITFGNNLFVAVGNNSTITTSSDGLKWRTISATLKWSASNDRYIKSITFGNNVFVAVANQGLIITSEDGSQWSTKVYTNELYSIHYLNNMFIIASDHWSLTSSNGYDWSSLGPINNEFTFYGIAYGNNLFLGVGSAGTLITSSDGINWINPQRKRMDIAAICYGNNLFVAYGHHFDTVYTSENGSEWIANAQNAVGQNKIEKMCYGIGLFVGVGHSTTGLIATSLDGRQWARYTGTIKYGLHCVRYINNKFFCVGDSGSIYTSVEGATWEAVPSTPTTQALGSIAYGNNTIVAVGMQGTILTSPDGTIWKQGNPGTTEDICGIQYGNDIFVAVGVRGAIFTSQDGINWTKQVSGMEQEEATLSAYLDWKTYGNMAFGNGIFAIVYFDGTILSSTDGINWIKNKIPTSRCLVDIAYGHNRFVAIGDQGYIVSAYIPKVPISRKYETNHLQNGNGIDISLRKNHLFVFSPCFDAHGPLTVTLFNLYGIKVHSSCQNKQNGFLIIPINTLPSGQYVASVTSGKNMLGARRIVLTK